MPKPQTAEHQRLADSEARRSDWKNWGPYVSDRAWGTVREDYSPDGVAWDYFPHDHARSRAYRWNEDGLAGVCNRFQNVCLAVALWNEQDVFLKERLFGLTNSQGNHGEDVKEYYFYLDNIPSHAYMKMLYKYPQAPFPYEQLVTKNQQRGYHDPEFELIDALGNLFAENRYFDVFIEYAKADEEDILARITATNRGPEPAPIHILPHIWYRNTWSWGHNPQRPELRQVAPGVVRGKHRHLGQRWWYAAEAAGNQQAAPRLLFTENDTNTRRVFDQANNSPYVKDGIHAAIVKGQTKRVNPDQVGTKAAAHFHTTLEPGQSYTVLIRYTPAEQKKPFAGAEKIFKNRQQEADEFYNAVQPARLNNDECRVQRQAFAGLLWSKQFYHYGIDLWLEGDPAFPPPPESRYQIRNADWNHLYNIDVISMPDKWEYPWYAAWDLAFHTLPLALIDPEWAKRQLVLMLREWYMHPNGQLPAYEWDFGDVNPPVHAWAAWRVYKICRNVTGKADLDFLERVFQKLLLNFTWWVNRKDMHDNNVFQGGFLGMDNIGVFDRSKELPTGGHLEQADGTAWMGMYCLNMLAIALELARSRPAYEDVATKFFEHFVYIAHAINHLHGDWSLWDAQDGFFYDVVHTGDGRNIPIKLRSFVGLIPLFAVETFEEDILEKLPRFRRRMAWFIKYRPELLENIAPITEPGQDGRRLLAMVDRKKLERVLPRLLDEAQFLSEYGLRTLSKQYGKNPFTFSINGETHTVSYEPAESTSWLFGGNSNWRGPIWFPVNYLMIESLQKYHHYFGDDFTTEFPRHSGKQLTLKQIAAELSRRLTRIFLQNESGRRPVFGSVDYFQIDPHWRDHILFYEYFHGDTGAGLGASHQTGWTALVAKLLQQSGGDFT